MLLQINKSHYFLLLEKERAVYQFSLSWYCPLCEKRSSICRVLLCDESPRILVALFFCDAYEFFTNFRIKELPIKLFPYNFVRPHKSCETRIIVVLYWKGFFLIRDIEVLSYFLGVTMAESKGMRWVMVYITPGRRWKWIFYKSYVFYNRSRTNLE